MASSSSSTSAHVNNNKKFAVVAAAPAASHSLSLGDLISLQLERLNLSELVYNDELQLLLLLEAPPQRRTKQSMTNIQVETEHAAIVDGEDGKAPLSKAESADDLIGAVGGLSMSPTSATKEPQLDFRTHVMKWFQQLRKQTASFKSDEESRRIREAGNDSYRKERHALKACDFFTEAMFLAPAKNSLAAAIAHANRSTVLHDCGMYAQSYDDCLCALDLGYPEEYLPLVKLRQASCALKMRNFTLCEEHLHELLHMELNEVFETRTHELWHQCEVLKSERFEMAVQTGDDLETHESKCYEIAWYGKTSSMRTIRPVAKNSTVFEEEALVMVPSGNSRLCDNCGVTKFVEFPCIYCSNRTAVYCSRQCRFKHAPIHALECFAHQIELFEALGDVFAMPRLIQLAFRMLITGMPQVVGHFRKKPTLNKLWAAFNGVLTERTDIAYCSLLRLETHTDAQDVETLAALAVVAHVLAIYLSKCTTFFDQLERNMSTSTKLSKCEWELLTAALLLRHICQLRHKHLVHCQSFVLPADPHIFSPLNEFQLWSAPMHVKSGHLHLIAGDVAVVAYTVYPCTLSLCQQSCADSISKKFSGRTLTALALSDIQAGATIYNCFCSSGNYQQTTREERLEELQCRGINCQCEKCLRSNPDEDFQKFHRYRCDNPQCMQIFTPTTLQHARNLRWWLSEYYTQPEQNGGELLICSQCDEAQKLEWFWTFTNSLLDCELIEERCKLYGAIERADAQLMELHECKAAMARQLLEQCLMVHREGAAVLDDWEFNKLGSIMRSALPSAAAQHGSQSLEYVKHFAYFWDIVALSNYKCTDRELMQMLNALEFIPDEYKEIFINYYEDYIAPKFAEESYGSIMDTQV
ncbi:uncharacterized protein LOC115626415 [Scaptodrosophila lebanonensis]|uniref:Uncharacterized protein LOC115626415 n=1 Tax=Drosophila lebanonensis TaxID=7225 RepID=A0A6J2TRQ1_DROLE|nr:uncharacterized protein LOC115626415 [Scaptodrosophila lebanonensis]